jgi:hypothetical protein
MTQTRCFGTASRPLAMLVLVVSLAACGKSDEDAVATAPPAQSGTAPAAASAPVADEDKHLANAVVIGKTAAAVDLKYNLPAKPAVGQPFEIELTFLPRLAADRLEVEATGIPGLALVGETKATFEGVASASRHVMRLLVNADGPGVYYVGIVARMVSKVQTDARTFSIPVVVGQVAATQKAAPATDAAGEAIESMPAVETTGEPASREP